MSKRHCFTCGQFTDSNHRCPGGAKPKAPKAFRNPKGNEATMLEPTVLFANKNTLITLLPDGSLLKTKTDSQGLESVTEAGFLAKLLYAGKIAKAKSTYPLNSQPEVKKSKVEKAWEAYAETEEAYTKKNEMINDIAKKVAKCKELIIDSDKAADKIMASAQAIAQEMVDKYAAEVKKADAEVKNLLDNHSGDFNKIANAMVEQAKAREIEKIVVDKANAILDEVTLKVYNLREAPRQSLRYLEEELANATKPDAEAVKKDENLETILGVEPEAN